MKKAAVVSALAAGASSLGAVENLIKSLSEAVDDATFARAALKEESERVDDAQHVLGLLLRAEDLMDQHGSDGTFLSPDDWQDFMKQVRATLTKAGM